MTDFNAMEYIDSTSRFGSVLGLENMIELLKRLKNPQDDLSIVHVAGTNGKGSTCAILNAILTEAGYKVGAYNSPALVSFNEGIKLGERPITDDELDLVTYKVKMVIEGMIKDGLTHPTQFEIVTAIALLYFKKMNTDIVLLEVGMGGRLDATNVIKNPLVSVITPIALDHVGFLGNTIGEVAYEKAGIIKSHSKCVVTKQDPDALKVIIEVAGKRVSKLYPVNYDGLSINEATEYGSKFDACISSEVMKDLHIALIGKHQVENALTALNVAYLLREDGYDIKQTDMRQGLKKAKWAGRLELLEDNPRILIDGAHNLHGARALAYTIKNVFSYNRLVAVIGILADKDIDGVFEEILPLCDEVIFTMPANPRAIMPEKLIPYAEKYNLKYTIQKDIVKAYELGKTKVTGNNLLLCCGSLYMIGAIKRHVIEHV